jgi:hypothetical protein
MATDFKSNMNLEKHFIPILNHSRICNFYPKETFSSSSSIRFRFGFGLDFNTWTIFCWIESWKVLERKMLLLNGRKTKISIERQIHNLHSKY